MIILHAKKHEGVAVRSMIRSTRCRPMKTRAENLKPGRSLADHLDPHEKSLPRSFPAENQAGLPDRKINLNLIKLQWIRQRSQSVMKLISRAEEAGLQDPRIRNLQ